MDGGKGAECPNGPKEGIGAGGGPSEGVGGSNQSSGELGGLKTAGEVQTGTTPDQPQEKTELRTSDLYTTAANIPKRFDHPEWFEGYGTSNKNPFYETSGSKYGSKPPSVHTMPTQFNGRSQKFTGSLSPFGMYRNHSLNTAADKHPVLADKFL